MRHEITLEDGRVFESCTEAERFQMNPGEYFTVPPAESYSGLGYYRLKKKEPRTWESVVKNLGACRCVILPDDVAVGTAVIVTEKVQG